MDNTINPDTANEIGHTGASHHTRQMQTDTVTDEREILVQRAMAVNTVNEARAIRDQIYEHKKMYQADEGVAVLDEQLKRLETMLGG